MGSIHIYHDQSSYLDLIAQAESSLGILFQEPLRQYMARALASHHGDNWQEPDWAAYWLKGGATEAGVAPLRHQAEVCLLGVGLYPKRVIHASGGLDLAMGCVHRLYGQLADCGYRDPNVDRDLFLDVDKRAIALVDVLMMMQERVLEKDTLDWQEASRFRAHFPSSLYADRVLQGPMPSSTLS